MAKLKFNLNEVAGGIIVPLLILGICIFGYFYVLPKYRGVLSDRQLLAAKQQGEKNTESELKGINDLVAAVRAQQAQLTAVNDALPVAPRIPELLANFDILTKQSGLFLSDLQITEAPTLATLNADQNVSKVARVENILSTARNLGVIQISLTLRGEYSNLRTFLIGLEQNLRLMDIQAFTVSSGATNLTPGKPTAGNVKEYSVILQTYYQKN